MDKQKAYEILNQAVAQLQTTRQNHQLLMEALNVLIKEPKPLKEEKPDVIS